MKILLLNDNPVVNKLVTLSAQKTSDELDIVTNVDDVAGASYDLVVVDDGIGSEEILGALKEKLAFSKSLYICTRDAAEVPGFDTRLKKPFLPTDLVELFAMFDKDIEKGEEVLVSTPVKDELVQSLESETEPQELEDLEDIALDEQVELDMEAFDLDEAFTEEGEELTLDDLDETFIDEDSFESEELGESVLDDEEAQKVKELLDEADEDASDSYHFDPHIASKELGLPLDVIEEFVSDFIAQAFEYKEELYASAVAEDFTTVHEIAHKLKGVATNLRIENAFEKLVTINNSSDKEEIAKKLDAFYTIIEKLKTATTESTQEDELDFDLALDLEDEADANIEDEDTLDELEDELLDFDLALDLEDEADIDLAEDDDMLTLDDELEESEEEEPLEEDIALPELEELSIEESPEIEEDETIEEPEVESEEEPNELFEEEPEEASEEMNDAEVISEEPEEELELEELESDDEEALEDKVDEAVTEELAAEPEELAEEPEEVEEEPEEVEEEPEAIEEEVSEPENIEQQIQEAVEDLSEEDLESELDDETLLEIAASEIDSIDKLSSKELKLALGEEIDEDEIEDEEEISTEDVEDLLEVAEEELEEEEKIEGVQALKKLLKALDDKDVAASMKGMKITINIELGEK